MGMFWFVELKALNWLRIVFLSVKMTFEGRDEPSPPNKTEEQLHLSGRLKMNEPLQQVTDSSRATRCSLDWTACCSYSESAEVTSIHITHLSATPADDEQTQQSFRTETSSVVWCLSHFNIHTAASLLSEPDYLQIHEASKSPGIILNNF